MVDSKVVLIQLLRDVLTFSMYLICDIFGSGPKRIRTIYKLSAHSRNTCKIRKLTYLHDWRCTRSTHKWPFVPWQHITFGWNRQIRFRAELKFGIYMKLWCLHLLLIVFETISFVCSVEKITAINLFVFPRLV